MANGYGQFTRRTQNRSANIRTSSVGGNRGNKNPKKKAKTLFGLKIGTPPKSDYQKKVDSGKATVFKTGAGGKITTTSTGKIMSVADQKKLKTDYTSASANYAKAKPAIGKAIQPTSKFKDAGKNWADFRKDSQYTLDRGAKDPVQSSSKIATISNRVFRQHVSPKDNKVIPVDKPKPVIPDTTKFQPTLLRKDKNQRLFSVYKGDKTKTYKFLESLGVKSGASPNKRGAFSSEVKKSASTPSLTYSKGGYQGETLKSKPHAKSGYQGVFQTSTANFMGQKKKLAKVGDKFYRIKKDNTLAKDALSGIQDKFFRQRLKSGKSELKWSLISGV